MPKISSDNLFIKWWAAQVWSSTKKQNKQWGTEKNLINITTIFLPFFFPFDVLVLGFGAVRANDVFLVGDETLADQRLLTHGAQEALVVPVSILKGDELGTATTQSHNGLRARRATLGKELGVTAGTVRLVLLHRKLLTRQCGTTVAAQETFLVKWIVLVRDTISRDDLYKRNNWPKISNSLS